MKDTSLALSLIKTLDSALQTAGVYASHCTFLELNTALHLRPLAGPALSTSRHAGLPTVFMGSSEGFNHKALAIIETVRKVLVSAGFEVLRPLSGICRCICQGKHTKRCCQQRTVMPSAPAIHLDLCTEASSWALTWLQTA